MKNVSPSTTVKGGDEPSIKPPETRAESSVKPDTNSSAVMVFTAILSALVALVAVEYVGGVGSGTRMENNGGFELPSQSVVSMILPSLNNN